MKRRAVLVLVCVLFMIQPVHAGEQVHWGYSGHSGPEHWGDLSEAFAACNSGKNQSPINLGNMVESDLPAIRFRYQPSAIELLNNGHTIQTDCDKGSLMAVDGHDYELLQFHFHAPSENLIEGRSFPMEAHFVHSDRDGNLAVIAAMYVDGRKNRFVQALWEQMPEREGERRSVPHFSLQASDLMPGNRDYYRYNGSLTTPPCTEGVLWLVMKNPVQVSPGQVQKFHAVMHHENNRPVQPVHARPVLK